MAKCNHQGAGKTWLDRVDKDGNIVGQYEVCDRCGHKTGNTR